MEKRNDVQVGQQYVKVHSMRNPPPVWEVKSILVENVPAPHAVLVNTRDPFWARTLACSALINNSDYHLVKAGAEHPTE